MLRILRVLLAEKGGLVAVENKDTTMSLSKFQILLNYCLNKFCPIAIIIFLVFSKFELTTWEPYVIIGLVLFIDRFSYKVGYSVAYCESKGIETHD